MVDEVTAVWVGAGGCRQPWAGAAGGGGQRVPAVAAASGAARQRRQQQAACAGLVSRRPLHLVLLHVLGVREDNVVGARQRAGRRRPPTPTHRVKLGVRRGVVWPLLAEEAVAAASGHVPRPAAPLSRTLSEGVTGLMQMVRRPLRFVTISTASVHSQVTRKGLNAQWGPTGP